ncbi:hypothetical protein C172_05477 [Paenibacillus sp. FSL H8-457]|nr:hypothetical protein C172_05477 [Paenibacillus sp. FSL H8-457]
MEWRIAIFNAGIGIKMRGVPGGITRGSFFYDGRQPSKHAPDHEPCGQGVVRASHLEKPSRNAPMSGVIFMLSSNILAFQDMV